MLRCGKRYAPHLKKIKRARLSTSGGAVTWKGRRRFYESASIEACDHPGAFRVLLDGKPISTPSANRLLVPSKALASALAHEWNAQKSTIEPSAMPLMTLTCSAIDTMSVRRDAVVEELMRFLQTDTLCYYRYDEPKLLLRQRESWTPLLDWANGAFGALDVAADMQPTQHPEETVSSIKAFLEDRSGFELTAIESLTQGCKSLVVALAMSQRVITPQEAIEAARVEEEHQIEEWGLVEGGHDVDRQNLAVQVAAASTMLWLVN